MERLAEKFIDASIIYGEAIEQGESKAANKQSSIIRKKYISYFIDNTSEYYKDRIMKLNMYVEVAQTAEKKKESQGLLLLI